MACGCGMGEAGQRFPALEKVLYDYIKSCLASGQPFYISPSLNSDVITTVPPMPSGMGGFGDDVDYFDDSGNLISDSYASGSDISSGSNSGGFFSSLINTAATIGTGILAALPSVASIEGSIATINRANQSLASHNVSVPTSIAGQAVNAVTGGFSLPLLAILGVGLFAVMALSR